MPTLDIAARIAAIILTAFLAVGIMLGGAYAGGIYIEYVQCKQSGENLGVQTIYRPWSGCQYVLFGLKVSA